MAQFPLRTAARCVAGLPCGDGTRVDHVDEGNETRCKRCRRLKVAVAGLCATCAVIVATPAIAVAAPLPSALPSQVKWVAWSPGDSEPFHPAEPDPIMDGPAMTYVGTVPTTHRMFDPPYSGRKGSRYNGGPAPTI